MSWAGKRRLVIALIIGAVFVAFISIVLIATLYQTPSCSDGIQNQNEEGIDCGGSCSYLCREQLQPPTILFTKALTNTAGRTDIIASIENKNLTAGAKNVPYRVRLYGTDRILLQEVTGTIDLPPGTKVPVFLPGITSGDHPVASAFLEIDPAAPNWFTLTSEPRILPRVASTILGGTSEMPRIEAILTNGTAISFTNVRAIVLVRDAQGGVIAASQTVLPLIPPQGQATATFTWNSPFAGTSAAIEVVPVIPLP